MINLFQTPLPTLALLTHLVLSGCTSAPVIMADDSGTLHEQNRPGSSLKIGEFTSSQAGFRTTTYWLEGPTGLILIDTQFLPSAALEFVERAERETGKKAELAIVLHPNPDKFNGTKVLQDRGIRVMTSSQVLALIPAVHQLRTEWFYDDYKPDYPIQTPEPESFGDVTQELTAGGITVKAHVLGAGCSDAHVVVEYGKNVFVGDLVTIGFHSWLELGHLKEWSQRLDEIKAMNPKLVRTGRGGTGGVEVLEIEKDYLQAVSKIVRAKQASGAKWSEKVAAQLLSEIRAKYPLYQYPAFVVNGLEEVWKQLKGVADH